MSDRAVVSIVLLVSLLIVATLFGTRISDVHTEAMARIAAGCK